MNMGRFALVWAIVAFLAPAASADEALWTTGPPNYVFGNYGACGCAILPISVSGFGYISGQLDAASPQRWTAAPFRLDAAAHITRLDSYYADPNGVATDVRYIVW